VQWPDSQHRIPSRSAATNVKDPLYICPMDPNMRSDTTDKRPTLSISIHSCGWRTRYSVNMVFARARMYRVWVEFQRNGVVNTARFDIPVKPVE
jgi:hypothetical protein